MPAPSARSTAARYRIRIAGRLDQRWSPWFEDFALTADEDGTTELTGLVADQAALHGVLTKVRDLGIDLISLTRVEG
jgi:hypothetical protein